MRLSRSNRIRQLAEAVASAFESAGYQPADLLQGPIAVTDLPWQIPPLRCMALLDRVPFHEYMDYPVTLDAEKLYDFYTTGMGLLYHATEDMGGSQGARIAATGIAGLTAGERNYAVSLPEQYPMVDHWSGGLFAIEIARLFYLSAPCRQYVTDASNYWVEVEQGIVGVVGGKPSVCADLWDHPLTNYIEGLLEQPRGPVNMDCDYDLIARVRSELHSNFNRFPEFEGIDCALQALRVLSRGRLCTELQAAIKGMSQAGFKRKVRAEAFAKAVEIMQDWQLADRVKLSMLFELLVPTYYSLRDFNYKVYDMRRLIPAVISAKVEQRIIKTLMHEHDKVAYANKAFQPD